jgi:hypothetical protein
MQMMSQCSVRREHTSRRSRPKCKVKRFLELLTTLVLCFVIDLRPALAAADKSPRVAAADEGARIEDVSIESYGVTNAHVAMRCLSLHKGDTLTQKAILRDYTNLAKLAGLRTRLEIRHRTESGGGVTLRWIVLGPILEATDHPFYGDQPLSIPIEGFGTILTSQPIDRNGANLSLLTQVALRAQLARVLYTKPLWVNSAIGREGDLIVNTFGARGVFRESEPVTQDIYS